MNNKIIVFTKPWKNESLEELVSLVKNMGFDGVELPVRDGYQVTPKNVRANLKEAVEAFKKEGLIIGSIAGSIEKDTIEAMGESKISLLRVCLKVDMEKGYFASVKEHQDKILEYKDLLVKNNVKIAIQNHHGYNIASALGLHQIMEGLPLDIAGSVLDFAHCGLDGEPITMAYDIVKDSLLMVNFKSAYQAKLNGPDEIEGEYTVLWSTSRNSLYSWKSAIELLKSNNYKGFICMPAEYNYLNGENPIMGDEAKRRALYDLDYIKSLMK
ncbi:MAG: sugar phosphate isomerase/epimerase family protein [Pleomorphochaeta sp.]